jgi:aryl-alcohol dehydrogenase-like predicted oxidoreductase
VIHAAHEKGVTLFDTAEFYGPWTNEALVGEVHAARQRILTGELDAASAAFEVGYESPSQFNREYRRFFGRPPIRDIKALRDGKVVAITTA